MLGGQDGEGDLVAEHEGTDIEGGTGIGGDPVGIHFYNLADSLHEIFNRQLGDNQSFVGIIGSLGVHVGAEQLGLGKSEMVSPQGAAITLYDKERCICDLIRARKHTDMQIYTQAIKDYFAHGADTRKLLKYAKKLGIEDKVRTYMEVLL